MRTPTPKHRPCQPVQQAKIQAKSPNPHPPPNKACKPHLQHFPFPVHPGWQRFPRKQPESTIKRITRSLVDCLLHARCDTKGVAHIRAATFVLTTDFTDGMREIVLRHGVGSLLRRLPTPCRKTFSLFLRSPFDLSTDNHLAFWIRSDSAGLPKGCPFDFQTTRKPLSSEWVDAQDLVKCVVILVRSDQIARSSPSWIKKPLCADRIIQLKLAGVSAACEWTSHLPLKAKFCKSKTLAECRL